MFPSQAVIDHLSSRIQQAYGLRRPDWRGGCSTSRVWNAAAERLWAAHAADPARVPLDPELFVASQPIAVPFADPWSELAQPESARRYRSTLRRIVRRLRDELKREVARAERLIERGRDICEVLAAGGGCLPSGASSWPIRAGRRDLANSLRRGGCSPAPGVSALSASEPCALAGQHFIRSRRHFAAHERRADLKPRVEKVLLSLN